MGNGVDRGKGQTSKDKGYVDRIIDTISDAFKPVDNTMGKARLDRINQAEKDALTGKKKK